ncbi:hypothetical protein AcW1_005908 [Taiwanofungus camphoratus]|nr:hypothetical protein AcW1_005908 [Antrodia cinnamomea]
MHVMPRLLLPYTICTYHITFYQSYRGRVQGPAASERHAVARAVQTKPHVVGSFNSADRSTWSSEATPAIKALHDSKLC